MAKCAIKKFIFVTSDASIRYTSRTCTCQPAEQRCLETCEIFLAYVNAIAIVRVLISVTQTCAGNTCGGGLFHHSLQPASLRHSFLGTAACWTAKCSPSSFLPPLGFQFRPWQGCSPKKSGGRLKHRAAVETEFLSPNPYPWGSPFPLQTC